MDAITEQRIAQLHPKIRAEVADLITKAQVAISPRLTIRIVQGLRTIEEQNKLYAQGRTTPGKIVTNAKGGSSYHNYGCAFDFAFIVDGNQVSWDTLKDFDGDGKSDWMEVIKIFTDAGYTSGGSFKSIKDWPHLEKTFGLNWRDLLARYNARQFIAGTQYVVI